MPVRLLFEYCDIGHATQVASARDYFDMPGILVSARHPSFFGFAVLLWHRSSAVYITGISWDVYTMFGKSLEGASRGKTVLGPGGKTLGLDVFAEKKGVSAIGFGRNREAAGGFCMRICLFCFKMG